VIAPDVNVLLYAFREDSGRHEEYRAWLQAALGGPDRVALFEPVRFVVRTATHLAIYRTPTPRHAVERFIDACLAAPGAMAIRAEAQHWGCFGSCARVRTLEGTPNSTSSCSPSAWRAMPPMRSTMADKASADMRQS
jgi:predicted nucleic acid-binding protein